MPPSKTAAESKTPPKKRAAKKAAQLNPNELKMIKGEPPVTPKQTNADHWRVVKMTLMGKPGQWFQVKVFLKSKNGASAKASDVNRGASKMFPKDKFEAKHALDEDDNENSILWMRYKE